LRPVESQMRDVSVMLAQQFIVHNAAIGSQTVFCRIARTSAAWSKKLGITGIGSSSPHVSITRVKSAMNWRKRAWFFIGKITRKREIDILARRFDV